MWRYVDHGIILCPLIRFLSRQSSGLCSPRRKTASQSLKTAKAAGGKRCCLNVLLPRRSALFIPSRPLTCATPDRRVLSMNTARTRLPAGSDTSRLHHPTRTITHTQTKELFCQI
ncbi:hypothetical protein E2C01_045562 [Portunus trituberculatus]|uniref:Uncharacterized protein n=1 Tax=Portunus trituberculatus TaxID=210409 RepID=A0A5B7FVA1_PORTR|nr:hypothetical protein [Portunus trituberculatus]